MAPALEIVLVKATEAYVQDQSVINPMLEQLAATKGASGIYHGLAPEDGTLVLFVVWDAITDHHALMADKVRYGALGAAFARAADLSTANMFHVYLDHLAFLDAPLVSFVHALPKAGVGADALAGPLAALNARPVPAGGRPGGGAKAVEKDEFVELYGWDDVKAFEEASGQQEVKQLLQQFSEVAEVAKKGRLQVVAYKKYQA
ncbi:hypothetical protein PsYK624_090180 [Phanerochaete sordida]|uniref:ABM domain-containing protein n=1 Tax=Phanerochaete sordida TaxID=48140 RepID=A0A9P3LF18_9APHY|nr:hypothetical protein PsYK624_090180 [Phanerochaete sordida]